jgi:hypothetical protein
VENDSKGVNGINNGLIHIDWEKKNRSQNLNDKHNTLLDEDHSGGLGLQ